MSLKITATLLLLVAAATLQAQSKVMQELHERHPDAAVFMLYHSTLNMLNVNDDEDYARMVYDIDRIKILTVSDTIGTFRKEELPKLRQQLAAHGFEELLSIHNRDLDMAAYVKQKANKEISGFFVIVYQPEAVLLIDVTGKVPAADISKLVKTINNIPQIPWK